MIRRPPRSTRTDALFPDTTLFRSARLGVLRAGEDAADQLVRHLQGVIGQSFLEVEQERNQRSEPSGGNISLDHIGRRSAAFPDILPTSVGMDAASHVRGDADLPHLPQAVENLADVIGPGRNGNGLERSELAHAAGVVKDLVEGVDLFGAKISDQGVGSLRSEEHTSELQSLMRISYHVFCLKKKKT